MGARQLPQRHRVVARHVPSPTPGALVAGAHDEQSVRGFGWLVAFDGFVVAVEGEVLCRDVDVDGARLGGGFVGVHAPDGDGLAGLAAGPAPSGTGLVIARIHLSALIKTA